MKIYTRGSAITFTHTFYDSSGDATAPSTANLRIAYPTTGYPLRSTALESTTVGLTLDTTTNEWSGTWWSGVSLPGTVFWSIRGTTVDAAEDGQIQIRANPANLLNSSST